MFFYYETKFHHDRKHETHLKIMFYISDLTYYIKFSSFSHCCGNVAGRPGSKSLSGVTGLFGADLETVVTRESLTGGVPGGVATSVTLATQAPSAVPIIIRRCVEEVERRGLDIIGRMDNNKCQYTGCPRRNVPDFRRVFLMLKYTDIIQNTYVQSCTVTEIMTKEKCGRLAGPRTVPVS